MSSILKVDDLRGNTSAGDITITSEGGSATMQLQQGVVKVWCTADENPSVTTRDSFNIASLTDNSAGNTSYTFTNAMNNSEFSAAGMASDIGSTTSYDVVFEIAGSRSTTVFRMASRNYNNGGTYDSDYKMISIHGDLA